jgi:hypothetical protein
MPFRRRRHSSPPPAGFTPPSSGGADRGRSHSPVDWNAFLRRVERKRRLLKRLDGAAPALPPDYFARATYASFRLDGLDVDESDVREALGQGDGERPILRSRQSQRLRNHSAILHHLESDLRDGLPLTTDGVVRWYTGISAGLSTTSLDQATEVRIDDVVRRINSPQLRMQAALQEIAAAHVKLLADPIVPSFNGILARLLLRYHLGRCGLPAVIFDATIDARPWNVDGMVRRLVEMLEASYDELLDAKK